MPVLRPQRGVLISGPEGWVSVCVSFLNSELVNTGSLTGDWWDRWIRTTVREPFEQPLPRLPVSIAPCWGWR